MSTNTILNNISHITRLAIFRPRCKICGTNLVFSTEDVVCTDCLAKVTRIPNPFCQRCGRPLNNRHTICGECIIHPPLFKKHRSYSIYSGALKELIHLFKYRGINRLKHLFASYYLELLEQALRENFHFIIPVPRDKSRGREFYPLLEIANIVSKKTGIAVWEKGLIKTKATEPQARLSRSKRLKNLEGVIQLKNPGHLEGKKILLIDDVYTTGTTIKKCTEALAEATVDISALTIARSI